MMAQRHLPLVLSLVVLLSACGGSPAAPGSGPPETVADATFSNVLPGQLGEMLKAKDFFFVNVHIPYEGEIEPTDAFIPYDQTEQRLNEYPSDRSAKIVLYCRSGRMSAIAAEALVRAGYTNIWNLDGGMNAWEEMGLPVVRK